MTTEELLIHELAERAGVSVRTIRYYMDEGLLPQPNYEGKYSYYKLSFLDRLELIRRLKDSYLPLREITVILNSLTDEEVRQKLKETPAKNQNIFSQGKTLETREKPGTRALKYIDHVMDEQSKYREKGTQEKNQPSFQPPTPVRNTYQVNQPTSSPASSNGEVWQRISLAPGVELHLRWPMNTETESRVRQIVNFTKKVFQNKSLGGIK